MTHLLNQIAHLKEARRIAGEILDRELREEEIDSIRLTLLIEALLEWMIHYEYNPEGVQANLRAYIGRELAMDERTELKNLIEPFRQMVEETLKAMK